MVDSSGPEVRRSEFIRQYLIAHPAAKSDEAIEAYRQQTGDELVPEFVGQIRETGRRGTSDPQKTHRSLKKMIPMASESKVCSQFVEMANVNEFSLSGGQVIRDLECFLVELCLAPARIKQGGELFQKEETRFLKAMEPTPDWSVQPRSSENRLLRSFADSRRLGLVDCSRAKSRTARISRAGRQWLSTPLVDRLGSWYAPFQTASSEITRWSGDRDFLGSSISQTPLPISAAVVDQPPWLRILPQEYVEAYRDSIHQSLCSLPLGKFFPLDAVIRHFANGADNPLLLGRPIAEIAGAEALDRMQRTRSDFQVFSAEFLERLFCDRLVPFGCFRAGFDRSTSTVAVAREPFLDLYFGKPLSDSVTCDATSEYSRVVVQPDFSITIIGRNLAALAELTRYSKVVRQDGDRSLQLKLDRDSIVQARRRGLSGEEILSRLELMVATPVAPNVRRQVLEWANWVRPVKASRMIVLRCEDPETAIRVRSTLGGRAIALGETAVGVESTKLTANDRERLSRDGIIIQSPHNRQSKESRHRQRGRSGMSDK